MKTAIEAAREILETAAKNLPMPEHFKTDLYISKAMDEIFKRPSLVSKAQDDWLTKYGFWQEII